MTNRITIKTLHQNACMLNSMTNNNADSYSRNTDGRYVANLGNYHISQAYGGYALHQMVNSDGGIADVFGRGHMPARDLHGLIWAYMLGLKMGRD
jgi:hypothetical protein